MLPIAQFAYNNIIIEITKISPFEANYSYCLVTYRKLRSSERNAYYTQIDANQLERIHSQLLLDIQFYIERLAYYYNKYRLKEP